MTESKMFPKSMIFVKGERNEAGEYVQHILIVDSDKSKLPLLFSFFHENEIGYQINFSDGKYEVKFNISHDEDFFEFLEDSEYLYENDVDY